MSMSGSFNWAESQIERALLWFERIALLIVIVLALLSQRFVQALAVVAILVVHGVVYWVASRGQQVAWRRWGLSLADVVLGGLVFYVSGDVGGQAGILGYLVAGLVAARLTLWRALAGTAAIWLVFTTPHFYSWLGLGEPFSTAIVVSFLLYLVVTLTVTYLVSMERRQTRVALENARLYDETNRRLQQVDVLYRVGRSLATLDTTEVLATVAETTVAALGLDVCGVFLHERDRLGEDWTVLQAVHDPSGTVLDLLGTRSRIDDPSWLDELVREAGYMVSESVETDEGIGEGLHELLLMLGAQSCLVVGLRFQDEPRGFVIAAERQTSRSFSPDEIQLCQAMAQQAAIAVENASLYERTDEALNKRLRELATIEEIDHELGTSLDYDRVVSLVLERATEACSATSGAIGILAADGQRLDVSFWHGGETEGDVAPGSVEWHVDRGVVGRVIRTAQPALVADVRAIPDYEGVASTTRSEVVVPIRREQQVIGVLKLESDQLEAFTKEDLHFVTHLADHASIAIENARRFAAQQRQLRELGILFETNAAVSSSLELHEVLSTVARQMARALDVSSCSISDWDPAVNVVTTLVAEARTSDPEASLSTADIGASYSLDDYPATAAALRDHQALVVQLSDPEADPAERELLAQMGQKSVLMVPLVTHDRVVGLAELYEGRCEREFSVDDVRLCRAIASQAAIAIENARLYEQTDERLQMRVDELTALQRITQELNATLEQDRILQVVLESAVQTTGATHGNVVLMNLDSGQLALRLAMGYSAEEQAMIQDRLRHPVGDSITHQVVEGGEARLVQDAQLESYTICVRSDTRSALAVPVFYQDVVVGVINLRHTEVGAFDREALAFVQALAEQAAIAIGNALRFEEQIRLNVALRERTGQMDGLLQVSRKLRTDVPLGEVLEEVAYAVQETVGFNIVMISVVEDLESSISMLRRMAAAGLPLDVFEQAKKVLQPLEVYERLFREEYRQGQCYFFPFQEWENWATELHTIVTMPEAEDWEEGRWHPQDMLLAPLRGAGGRLLGHLSVDEPRDGRRPSRRTLEVLAIFANQATIAVENAYLYADAQRRGDNLTLINEVGRTLSEVLEPERVLDVVVKGVGLLLQCEMGAVFQLDQHEGALAPVASYGVDLRELAELRSIPGEGVVGGVASSAAAVMIPDTSQDPRCAGWSVSIGSMMLVPVVIGRQMMGVLMAGSPRKHALAEADQVLLTTLADQAAVALESARLFAGTQRAAEQLSLLNEIGRQAASRLELEEMLSMTVRALHLHLGYFRVAVFLVDLGTRELYVAAANDEFWSVIPDGYRQKAGEGLVGAAAATGKTVLANDAPADERFVPVGAWSPPASLSVPIKVLDRVIGVLHAEADRTQAFTDEDAGALEIAADQLAVAIQNARLFEETQRRVAELATINQIGRAISGALDADQLAELIYNQVGNLLDTRNFHIALYDVEAELIHVDFLIEHGRRQPPVVLRLGQGLTSYLVRTGRPILLRSGTDEFLRAHNLSLEREPAKSWLGVPMIAEDRVIGAIAVQSYVRENAFDAGHLDLLTTIAGQAAVAFQNAALFEERQKRIEQLAVVNRMAQATSSTLELDELLQVIDEQVSQLLDIHNFFIATCEEGSDEWTMALQRKGGKRQPIRQFRLDQGLTGYIIRNREPLLLRNAQESAGFHEEQGIEYAGARAKCWLGVPMVAEDKVLGVIGMYDYEQEQVYTEEHLHFLSTLAAQAAVALRNVQLYQQIVRFSSELEEVVQARTRDLEEALGELTSERDRAETLYRITSELGATLDLERVLQRALQLFADALGIAHGTVTLLDQESGILLLKATLDAARQVPREGWPTPLRQGVGLAGWVLENRQPALVPDVTQDPRWIEFEGKETEARSVVAAPLSLGGGDILGVLTLGHPRAGYFTTEHLQMVTAAAAQVAIAVNNSDLYAFITDQADQLGQMVQTQQSEAAKSRAILESIADGVLVLDYNGRVLLVNPAAEEMLGFAAIALEGEHFRHMLGLGEALIHRELAQLLYAELRRQLERSEDDEEQFQPGTVRLESGGRVLAVNVAPLITTLGGTPGLVAALRDISREAEVERLKDEFISTVSHELRTPMTSIKGYTDLLFLGMAGGLTDAQRSFLQIIKSNADRLTALVNDILDISRIETGRLRLTIEPLDLGEIISQVITAFGEQYREKGVGLEWAAPEGLPEVRGDAARVTQILNNLVANAWQYTPSGGSVTVSVSPQDGFLQVDVADTGIGIAPEDIGRVFDRFYRVDHPVVQEAGGTGLGLSIVKMFVEMLGGEIWIESEVDVGSKFSFTMPLLSAEALEVTAVTADLLTTEPQSLISRRPKILVVEDDRDLALLLRRQLESEGYQVLLAGSGEDALWLAREEQPQLITLDIMLPDLDGFTILEQLKDHPLTAPIPVVITSVLAETEQGYALGAVDYVVKPFSEDDLLSAVRGALSPLEGDEPHRLLVVDDDPDILTLMEEALTFHGYQVLTAAGGQEALDQIQASRPDLILLDLKMPGVDGYEVIRRIKGADDTRPIPIIVITASPVDKERDKVRVLGMGAAQYITKPLSIEVLIREIKRAIAEKQPL